MMKLIKAIIRPEKETDVIRAIEQMGLSALTKWDVLGRGRPLPELRDLDVEPVARAERHREIGATVAGPKCLSGDLEAAISQKEIGRDQLGPYARRRVVVFGGTQLLADLVTVG